MNLDAFLGERSDRWEELDALLRRSHGRPERLGSEGVSRLGKLYRGTAADLAIARRSFPGDPVVVRLEGLVVRAQSTVYQAPARRGAIVRFYSRDYWRLICERPQLLALSALLLFGSAALAYAWARSDPGAAVGLVPKQFQPAASPPTGDRGLTAGQHAAFSSEIFTNNIRVTLLAFAGGIFAGLGTAFVLIFNGVLLGAIAGLATGAGNGQAFVDLVTAHGVLELSCIVVAGMAGLRLGSALIDPGSRRRSVALAGEARTAVMLVLGTAPWLVVAGLVEGFVTPSGFGTSADVVVGVTLGVIFWGLAVWRGTGARAHPLQTRARAFALR